MNCRQIAGHGRVPRCVCVEGMGNQTKYCSRCSRFRSCDSRTLQHTVVITQDTFLGRKLKQLSSTDENSVDIDSAGRISHLRPDC